MSRRGWVLFALMGVLWGIPYLMIKVAVEGGVAVPVVVFARTALGALVLLPLVLWGGAGGTGGGLGTLRRHWKPILAFAALEILGPWALLVDAERHLSSSMTGLLIAAVPIAGVLIARLAESRPRPRNPGASPAEAAGERLDAGRWIGLLLGLAGVAVLAVPHLEGGSAWAIGEMMLVVLGYSIAPMIAARRLGEVPSLQMTVACLTLAALVYAGPAAATWPASMPDGKVLAALAGLGIVCTALAFVVFFELIREAGTSRAMVFTYVNPAVAVSAGVLFLDEPLTGTILAAFALILCGSVLATGRRRNADTVRPVEPVQAAEPST
ncbi:EamA family transporter [Actinomadura vinacea]|uniref:EamA family transporter n=1 Tax=Actinomadura vinacea TaxID=115336 RepID=A0ABP5X2T9_9ACTN